MYIYEKLVSYILTLFVIVSCLQKERSPEEILVPTLANVESTETSLMLTSKVPKVSEKHVEECGFYYSTDKSMANSTKVYTFRLNVSTLPFLSF